MLVNSIAFFPRPLRRLSPVQVVSANAFGSDTISRTVSITQTQMVNSQSFGSPRAINGYQLAPTVLNNSNTFGSDRMVKQYAQMQVPETNTFGDNIIGSGVSAEIVTQTNTFGSDKFVKIYTQSQLTESNTFGSARLKKLLETTKISNSQSFGADSFTKKYAQTQVSNSASFGSDTISGTATYSAWDTGLSKSANVALSGSNLIATATAGSDKGASAANCRLTGKYYFELTFNSIGGGDSGGGIRTAGTTYSDLGTNVTNGALAFRSGNAYVDTVGKNNIGSFSGGGTMCIAVDLDNKMIWFRKDGGSWNAGGGADPATNNGGYDISSFAPGAGVYPCCIVSNNGDACTANFGASAFNQSVPSGFTSGWPGADESSLSIDLDSTGTTTFSSSSSSSVTLPGTNGANRTVVVCIHNEKNGGAPAVSSVTATGLTFTRQEQYHFSPGGTTDNYLEVWTAPASSALGSTSISISLASSTDDSSVVCFSAAGVNSSTPMDGDASLPKKTSASNDNGPASLSGVSTTHADTLLFAVWVTSGGFVGPKQPSGFCQAGRARNTGGANWSTIEVFAKTLKSTISSQTFTTGTYGSSFTQWGMLIDALTK
jgi:hypothetical protein